MQPLAPPRIGVGSALDIPVIHENDRYELVRDIGSGNFGVARLMRDKITQEPVAVKFIERGEKIDENVQREIVIHRELRHPNIVYFKEVFLTQTHLGIVMEYAPGGELFERINRAAGGRFTEDEARYFFQQLVSGVSYVHTKQVCHRDLKLENILLDGSAAPRLKICDFGYSKSTVLHSQPKSTVGTPAYIAPEVLSRQEYDGKSSDVWSCGVSLYVMLFGRYPFEDPQDPHNPQKTIRRILEVQYTLPDHILISPECKDLISQIFVKNPNERIKMADIQKHKWFLKNLPAELINDTDAGHEYLAEPSQSVEEIKRIIEEAKISAFGFGIDRYLDDGSWDYDDMDLENDMDLESSGEYVCAVL